VDYIVLIGERNGSIHSWWHQKLTASAIDSPQRTAGTFRIPNWRHPDLVEKDRKKRGCWGALWPSEVGIWSVLC